MSAPTEPRKKAICPSCGKSITLAKHGGWFLRHSDTPTTDCYGSYRSPSHQLEKPSI